MKQRYLAGLLLACLGFWFSAISAEAKNAKKTRVVEVGKGEYIQDAINEACASGRLTKIVLSPAAVFGESLYVYGKSCQIILTSKDPDSSAVIVGDEAQWVIKVSDGAMVTLSRLTLHNIWAGTEYLAAAVVADTGARVLVENSTINTETVGVLVDGAELAVIRNNSVFGNGSVYVSHEQLVGIRVANMQEEPSRDSGAYVLNNRLVFVGTGIDLTEASSSVELSNQEGGDSNTYYGVFATAKR